MNTASPPAMGTMQTPKTKILFDGNCVVCDIEISHYKRLAPDLFELVDISAPGFAATSFQLMASDVEKNLHVFTPDGQLKIGVDAFSHIWSRIPRYRIASTLIHMPVLNTLAKIGYAGFTAVRPYLPKRSR